MEDALFCLLCCMTSYLLGIVTAQEIIYKKTNELMAEVDKALERLRREE